MSKFIPRVRMAREIYQERRSDNSHLQAPHLSHFPETFHWSRQQPEESAVGVYMAFFQAAIGVLQTLVIALGAGLGIWGAINLLEGYGNDNPGANAHVR